MLPADYTFTANDHGFHVFTATLNTVGPTLRMFGSEEQKREILPKILAGIDAEQAEVEAAKPAEQGRLF